MSEIHSTQHDFYPASVTIEFPAFTDYTLWDLEVKVVSGNSQYWRRADFEFQKFYSDIGEWYTIAPQGGDVRSVGGTFLPTATDWQSVFYQDPPALEIPCRLVIASHYYKDGSWNLGSCGRWSLDSSGLGREYTVDFEDEQCKPDYQAFVVLFSVSYWPIHGGENARPERRQRR